MTRTAYRIVCLRRRPGDCRHPAVRRRLHHHADQLYRRLRAGGARHRAADRRRRPDLVRAGLVRRLGAYSTAWLTTAQRLSPWLGLLFALLVTGSVAAFLGAVTLRLGGHFLPLSTIAWGLSIYFMFGNIDALGALQRHRQHPADHIGSISLAPSGAIFYLIWGAAAACRAAASRTCSTRARAARCAACAAARVLVESLGVNAFRVRLIVFVIAALLAALVRLALRPHDPLRQSRRRSTCSMGIEYLFMAILGGVRPYPRRGGRRGARHAAAEQIAGRAAVAFPATAGSSRSWSFQHSLHSRAADSPAAASCRCCARILPDSRGAAGHRRTPSRCRAAPCRRAACRFSASSG